MTYEDQVLLIHRGLHKKLAPGLWSCVGGHLEEGELNDPTAACLREIEEETGIVKSDIAALNLRYMTIRQVERDIGVPEISIAYYFIGQLARLPSLIETPEGTLHFVDKAQLLAHPMGYSVGQVAQHWLNTPQDAVLLFAVGANNQSGTWVRL